MRIELHQQEIEQAVEFTITFDCGELTLTDSPFGVRVALDGLGSGGRPGAPALPTTQLRVAVQEGMWPRSITIAEENWQQVAEAGTFVTPAQYARPGAAPTHLHCSDDCSCRTPERAPIDRGLPAPPSVPPDPDLYAALVQDPPPIARAAGIEIVGGVRIAVVDLAPVRMGRKGELELCRSVRVVVEAAKEPGIGDFSAAVEEFRERFGEAFDEQRVVLRPEPEHVTERETARLRDIARSIVINPDVIGVIDLTWPVLELPSDYLIVTDDVLWDARTIRPGAARPGIVAHFRRLAQAKRARGVSARVVTITDIVDGRWGDFRTGSRDLAEVIRRFLKAIRPRWGVQWLLLGGDIDIVPARHVASGLLGGVRVGTDAHPPNGQSFWTGRHLRIHAAALGDWWANSTANRLVRVDDGTLIPYDSAGTSGSASPGWYFTTAEDYATRSATPTEYIRVEGSRALVETALQFIYTWNSIPTDFYYASLDSWVIALRAVQFGQFEFTLPFVYRPEHDWDAAGNGIYGQHHVDGSDIDGVLLQTDLSVGRAPVEDDTQAATFVDKTLAYERAGTAWGRPGDRNWPRRMTLVSSDWGGRTLLWPTTAAVPGDNFFRTQTSSSRALLKLAIAPEAWTYDLVARISDTDRRELPFKHDPSSAVRGWYYAKSATDAAPSVVTIPLGFVTISFPVTSRWIVVHGTTAERSPAAYEFNPSSAEGSMADQEQLRHQIGAEVPGIDTFSRYYEDERDLSLFQRLAAPVQYLTESGLRGGLDAGPHLVSLSGHGSQWGVAFLSTGMAQGLSNGSLGFIGYADSCLTNGFDTNDSMSEALLLNPSGGAVAYVGNTRFSWIGVGDDFQRAFFHRLATTRHLGLLNDSRLTVYGSTGFWRAYERWQIFSLNLLGDPELRVYRAAFPPLVLDATFTDRVRSIRVLTEQQPPIGPSVPGELVPVEGALVHLRRGELEAMARTHADGTVEIPDELGGFDLEITASHDDYAVVSMTSSAD